MRIRCKNCYRVLNNDEEWCTRCGAHSEEVAELLKTGIEPLDEVLVAKQTLIFYLLLAFIATGAIDVLFGIIFNVIHSGYNYGDVGSDLPLALAYFSGINALIVSGIITLIVIFFLNVKEIKRYFHITSIKKFLISLGVGAVLFTGLVFLTKYSPFTMIPIYLKQFFIKPTDDMLLSGSMSLFKVILVMMIFSVTEELTFRKALISGIDEGTLLPDYVIVVIQALVGMALSTLCYLIVIRTTFVNYLWWFLGSFVLHFIMGVTHPCCGDGRSEDCQ